MASINGTPGNDTLTGTELADEIFGRAGNDVITGNDGDDNLFGEDGNDQISGGAGNDLIDGGAGDDTIVDDGGYDLIFGGPGNDIITIASKLPGLTVVDAGDGNDDFTLLKLDSRRQGNPDARYDVKLGSGDDRAILNFTEGSGNLLDLGAGNDMVRIVSPAAVSVTLGPGVDTIDLSEPYYIPTDGFTLEVAASIITDLVPGIDRIMLPSSTVFLPTWDGISNPFAGGFLRLAQSGPHAVLLIDRDDSGNIAGGFGYETLLIFSNTRASEITAADFGGLAPNAIAPLVFNNSANFMAIVGSGGDDIIAAGARDNRIIGGLGNDVIDGGRGVDSADFSGTLADYEFIPLDGAIQVRDRRAYGDGIDTLISIEQLTIDGITYSLTSFDAPGGARVADFTVGAGGWSSQDRFQRQMADVNGDGLADIVGFGQAGVLVALGQVNGRFAQPFLAVANFGVDQGWSSDNIFRRELADVNGDGRDDIAGFGTAGVLVSLAQTDGKFGAVTLGSTNFNPANGWTSQDGFARALADVNGDGFADIVGFGVAGTFVALGTGTGSFGTANFTLANFGANQGWTSDDQFHRALGDVNGDGRADIVGFGTAGTLVSLRLANGNFAAPILALDNFGTSQSWTSQDRFPRRVADVNGDGFADIVGFNNFSALSAAGQADGSFNGPDLAIFDFNRNQGWTSDNIFHRELADVNGDGRADVVGFGQNGVFAALAFSGQVI